jgi:coenzyme F420-reducing hydrogenase alpha subunit
VSGIREGEICLTASLARGAVQHVSITADRPLSLASAMVGRPVGFVAEAIAALHALCGQSHAAAVHLAAAAARGEALSRSEIARWTTRLAGERLAEHLRSLAVRSSENLSALRAAIAVGQSAARNGTVPVDAASRLAAALAHLDPGSATHGAGPVDALSSADDEAIIAALAADTGFIRAPHLPGRMPETGPAARHGLSAAEPEAAAAARVAEARDAVAHLLDSASSEPDGWITAGPAGPNAGYAAVETPRGRLYYRLVIGNDGQLLEARVLAPTEWNFHPAGPLVRALTGFRPGADALAAITRRAAAFDPCVALRVAVESAADA